VFRKFLLSILILFFSAISFADESNFKLILSPDYVTEQNQSAINQYLEEAANLLPESLKKNLNKPIAVKFARTLDNFTEIQAPLCNDKNDSITENSNAINSQILGEVRKNQNNVILLNVLLIDEIVKGPKNSKKYNCGHKTFYKLALATLLHEISHLYDFSEPKNSIYLQNLKRCQSRLSLENSSGKVKFRLPPKERFYCKTLTVNRNAVSSDPAFLSLIDLEESGFINKDHSRSPKKYEFKNSTEAFAVNMEFYLLDPEYPCRRPALAEYLRNHFGDSSKANCQINYKTELTKDSFGKTSGPAEINLDPSRIYQIHYLLAGPGSSIMSRWGHAMFRLITCNASRKTVGPECLNDINDHIVISFRANTEAWQINSWKGLTGKYPSQMFLYRFYPSIVNTYTVDEFRDLTSLPLKLTEEEKHRFINKALERIWGYSSDYYFISNNCATETLRFLKSIYHDLKFQIQDTDTPTGIYDLLVKSGLIDPGLLTGGVQNTKSFYFKSQDETYKTAYENVSKTVKMPFSNFDDYIQNSSASERRQLYNLSRSSGSSFSFKIENSFFALETYLIRVMNRQFVDSMVATINSKESDIQKQLEVLSKKSKEHSPLLLKLPGYGVPLIEDLAKEFEVADNPKDEETERLYSNIINWAQDKLSVITDEITATKDNQRYFLSEIQINHKSNR
jgi:hypothetical protein